MPARRRIAIAVCLLAVASGCSSGGAEADGPAASTTSTATSTAIAIPAPTAPAPGVSATLLSAVPDVDVAALLGQVVGLAEEAATCTAFGDWADRAGSAAELMRSAADLVETDAGELGSWRYSADAERLVEAIQVLLVDEPACPTADIEALLELSGQVSGAIDALRTAITRGPLGVASGFWLNFDFVGHTQEILRLQEEEGAIEILLMGDSATKRGFDPLALGESTGRIAMNAGADGLLPTMVSPWFAELTDLGVDPDVVVLGITPWGAVAPCGDARSALLAWFRDSRTRAFAGLGETGPSDAERVLGRPLTDHDSPLIARYRAQHDPAGRGRYANAAGSGAAEVEAQIDYHAQLFSSPTPCAPAIEQVEALAARLVGAGTRVVIVGMPVSPDMANTHPDGRAGQEEILALYEQAAASAGAEFVSFADALTAEEFADPSHPNLAGQVVLTERLAAILS